MLTFLPENHRWEDQITHKPKCRTKLGGGFKYFWFSPQFGEDSHFDKYFSGGLKPPTSKGCARKKKVRRICRPSLGLWQSASSVGFV